MTKNPVWPAIVADSLSILAFAAVGMTSHGSDPASFLRVVWPFALAAAAGWAWTRAWSAPDRVWPVGVSIWFTTVFLGLILRAVTGGGFAVSFGLVTAIFLAVTLVGWRALVTALRRAAERRTA
ncbi:DUF3054 domain-containing protein [Antribacter sp. KLBMP9083]|uniref:DUF3054 domain-containing protein n=1 Tax=Antribacter soli TaxID=2910976 RepID=A0AA41QCS4_9MICO|nr:DUF3054 domain-containing protein [Antribacter soli]MCF4119769.1 DUF3054 domain-containing protein [Antribacter soli]